MLSGAFDTILHFLHISLEMRFVFKALDSKERHIVSREIFSCKSYQIIIFLPGVPKARVFRPTFLCVFSTSLDLQRPSSVILGLGTRGIPSRPSPPHRIHGTPSKSYSTASEFFVFAALRFPLVAPAWPPRAVLALPRTTTFATSPNRLQSVFSSA